MEIPFVACPASHSKDFPELSGERCVATYDTTATLQRFGGLR